LKIRNGTVVENIVTNLCAKFNYDRLQNEKVYGIENLSATSPKKKNNKSNVRHTTVLS